MGIYVTGDCHGDFKKLIDFIERMSLDENDTIIVLGDMGLLWNAHNDFLQYFIANFYEVRYKTEILWIDGNHENFDLIKKNYHTKSRIHIPDSDFPLPALRFSGFPLKNR